MQPDAKPATASPETDPHAYAKCAAFCPECQQDCMRPQGHLEDHRCPAGHSW